MFDLVQRGAVFLFLEFAAHVLFFWFLRPRHAPGYENGNSMDELLFESLDLCESLEIQYRVWGVEREHEVEQDRGMR